MRLADFITANIEPILAEWELFARSLRPGRLMNPVELGNDAARILESIAADMVSTQTKAEQASKSKGRGVLSLHSTMVNTASIAHAEARSAAGFDLLEMVSEYRALRASVIALWQESVPELHKNDLEDLWRFNEAMDQSLTVATQRYVELNERARHLFLAILGHDLRNPLAAINAGAQVLSRPGHLPPELARVANGIGSSSRAIQQITRDLIEFAGARLGAPMPLTPRTMDLCALCREVVGETLLANPAAGVTQLGQGTELVGQWDPIRLRQVVSNLLGNAVQHGKGPIKVVTQADGSSAVLTVHSMGDPIPPPMLATIFNPLARHETTLRARGGNLGLGLHIVREIVTAHGGTIEVTSTKDEGTRFTVRLPRTPGRDAGHSLQ